MRELRVVYNPRSQRGRFSHRLDRLAELAQSHGYTLSLFRLTGRTEQDKEGLLSGLRESAVVVACGGDGTLQLVVDAMVRQDMDLPVGVLPYGTSNDFADFLGISNKEDDLMDYLVTGNVKAVDVGCIGDRCFINVFSAGHLTKTSHQVERKYKNALGMLAYYLHGMGHLPRIAPFAVKLYGQGIEESFNCLLLLVLNSGSAGGFKNLAPKASLDDGLLEVVAVRECTFPEMASVLVSVLRGDHQNNPAVLYSRAAELVVDGSADVDTDIDGERGPELPVKIQVIPRRIRLLGASS